MSSTPEPREACASGLPHDPDSETPDGLSSAFRVVYRITFPNGKIYVGKDLTDTITYFGSPSAAVVAKDFTREERQSFTITRDILWEKEGASDSEVSEMEVSFIRKLRSNDPRIGHNRWPKWSPCDEES